MAECTFRLVAHGLEKKRRTCHPKREGWQGSNSLMRQGPARHMAHNFGDLQLLHGNEYSSSPGAPALGMLGPVAAQRRPWSIATTMARRLTSGTTRGTGIRDHFEGTEPRNARYCCSFPSPGNGAAKRSQLRTPRKAK